MGSRSKLIAVIAGSIFSAGALAAEITVLVLDRDGNPVPDVAVFAEFTDGRDASAGGRTAVMDQIDTRFVPHILVIQKGTSVEFPNSDTIAHHVYSFSRPNDFMLGLYKGDRHPPVSFDHTGVVTLGCNIHDQMLAFILVVDSDVFAKTDSAGIARLAFGERQPDVLAIWSPRIRAKGGRMDQPYRPATSGIVTFEIADKLRPPHHGGKGSLEWSDY